MTASFAVREKSNVPVKLLRPKQTETDQETSHIINHTQPMRGESARNYLYKIFCFLPPDIGGAGIPLPSGCRATGVGAPATNESVITLSIKKLRVAKKPDFYA